MVKATKTENDCLNKGNKFIYAPPNSLRDLNVNLRVKQQKRRGVEACSLTRSIWGIGKRVGVLRWD
jgi:hypothetical protein